MDQAPPRRPTLAEAICAAMLEEIRRRRDLIDGSVGCLASVSITCKLQDGPDPIRVVVYEDQIVRRRMR